MPDWVVEQGRGCPQRTRQGHQGQPVLVLGIAYKKNVDDTRESPSVAMMELLRSKGAAVEYSDPHVPVFPKMREHHFALQSAPLTPDSVASYDLLLWRPITQLSIMRCSASTPN